MASKLETFLTDKKIDSRKLVAVSSAIESLQPEDRAIRLVRRRRKEGEEKKAGKMRSGRPVNVVALSKIYAGKPVNGPTKTRVLRAVNKILEAKKQAVVTLGDLFDLAKKE